MNQKRDKIEKDRERSDLAGTDRRRISQIKRKTEAIYSIFV